VNFNPMFGAWLAAGNANMARINAENAQRAARKTSAELAALKAQLGTGLQEHSWALLLAQSGYSVSDALSEAHQETARLKIYPHLNSNLDHAEAVRPRERSTSEFDDYVARRTSSKWRSRAFVIPKFNTWVYDQFTRDSGPFLAARQPIEQALESLKALGRSPIDSSTYDAVIERSHSLLTWYTLTDTRLYKNTRLDISLSPAGPSAKVAEVRAHFSGESLLASWSPPPISTDAISGYRVHVKVNADTTWTFDTVEPFGTFILPTVVPGHDYVVSVDTNVHGKLTGRGMGIFVKAPGTVSSPPTGALAPTTPTRGAFCTSCGAGLKIGAKFCGGCGAHIG